MIGLKEQSLLGTVAGAMRVRYIKQTKRRGKLAVRLAARLCARRLQQTGLRNRRDWEMRKFAFLYGSDLPHRAISVYIYLSDRANKDGVCWPAIPTIAKDLNLSQSTVRRALSDLRKVGLLETEQRYRKSGGKSSLLYTLREQSS